MNWLLQLYPAQWRERYGEEFSAVLSSQHASLGMVFDVLGGAVDAHLHPQIQQSNSKAIKGDDTMTLAMLQRCSLGGPKLSPDDRRIARRVTTLSALALAALELGLTKVYRGAPAVQALIYASAPALGLVYEQTAYLRKRSRLTQAFILGAGTSAMYLFMLAIIALGSKL